MKVLITGANGMLAKAVIAHCRSIGDDVAAFSRDQLDISEIEQIREIFRRERPQAVLNCAAFTDVDGAERNVEKCFAANSTGVENLAVGSKEIDCAFATISTDYVFGGAKSGFYTQRDTPEPLASVYSRSKLDGEFRAKKAYARSIVIRSGWIFGSAGTNFLSVMHKLLADGRSINVIGDSFGTPTFAGDLAKRMRELVELDLPTVFHVVNSGEGTSYAGFAEAVCEIGGFDPDLLNVVKSDSLSRPAPRPKSSKLACLFTEKFGLAQLPFWKTALAEFIHSETN
ncbi:MAG: dTDP-4-dehydrorhamnose reductase [Pyrinomonadaceae bacterium]|nr:dTDP-4-dehydrorhamnose reductase [Pyrinomonadaceae bacterium]